MTNNMSYSSGQYLPPPPQYYHQSPTLSNPVHIVPPPPSRPEVAQRKRPKYTRSKTGCLTCRVKKIKCDETKPSCMRCTHGSRDCTWPEGVPTRKKSAARKDSLDERPSTAGSSGLSEASTPPTREHTPPRRHQSELNLVPLPSRSSSDSFVGMDSVASEHDSGRRPIERASSYSHSHPSSNTLSMIPESAYSPRYDYLGSGANQSSRHNMSAPYRPLSYQPPSHWSAPPEPLDPYYHGHYNSGIQDRPLVGHNSPNDHSHNRYQ